MKIIAAAVLIIVFTSCSSRQDINISKSGAGSCTLRVDLNSFFVDYLKDLSEAGGSTETSVFDKQIIENSFNMHSNAELSDVRIYGKGSLEIDLAFKSPDQIFMENTLNPIILFKKKNGVSFLSFNLNTENYKALSRMTGLADNPVLTALTPQPEKPYTNDEYLDMMDFLFSDYEGGENAAPIVSKLMIEINIKTDGQVIKADNGKINGNTVQFKIPLLKFLTLSKPVEFSVEYK